MGTILASNRAQIEARWRSADTAFHVYGASERKLTARSVQVRHCTLQAYSSAGSKSKRSDAPAARAAARPILRFTEGLDVHVVAGDGMNWRTRARPLGQKRGVVEGLGRAVGAEGRWGEGMWGGGRPGEQGAR